LLRRLRAELRRAGDPQKAAGMRAYMKSAMPYHGVPAPALRRICRQLFATLDLVSAREWREAVLALFRGAKHREERYAAVALAERGARAFEDLDALPMYEEMIATGAWWDIVDVIASHRLGALLRKYPEPMRRTMRKWSRSRDIWKRRASILCQLGFKRHTDLSLLYTCIEPSLASQEFFLRKAIGWALRQYAWTDPDEVRRYVREHANELSRLTRREALKNV
jgi:3-methyladenine DNA glycosylase AlkD